jgi:hypothetical protein
MVWRGKEPWYVQHQSMKYTTLALKKVWYCSCCHYSKIFHAVIVLLPGLEIRENGRGDPFCWPRDTHYPQKLTRYRQVAVARSVQFAPGFYLFFYYIITVDFDLLNHVLMAYHNTQI